MRLHALEQGVAAARDDGCHIALAFDMGPTLVVSHFGVSFLIVALTPHSSPALAVVMAQFPSPLDFPSGALVHHHLLPICTSEPWRGSLPSCSLVSDSIFHF